MDRAIHDETEHYLRMQRHDFINHLQVIQGFIQLGKPDKALKYIEDIVKSPELTGKPRPE